MAARKIQIETRAHGAADEPAQIFLELHPLVDKQVRQVEALVADQVALPAVGGIRVGGERPFAGEGMGRDAHGRFRFGINEGRRHFAVIDNAQRAVADPAVAGHGDTIRAAAIGLHDRQQALARLGKFQAQQFPGVHAHAHAQHLAWAEMMVQTGRFLQQPLQQLLLIAHEMEAYQHFSESAS